MRTPGGRRMTASGIVERTRPVCARTIQVRDKRNGGRCDEDHRARRLHWTPCGRFRASRCSRVTTSRCGPITSRTPTCSPPGWRTPRPSCCSGSAPRSTPPSSTGCRASRSSARSASCRTWTSTCARGSGIVVSSRLGGSLPSFSTAELTWGLVLAAVRRIPQQAASLRAGGWQDGIGHLLLGRTLGIYGYGRIGRVIAGYGRAFGMTVQAWGRAASLDAARADGIDVCADRDALFATSDVLSLHLRLVPETIGIVTGARARADAAGRAPRQHQPGRRCSRPAHSKRHSTPAGPASPRSTCSTRSRSRPAPSRSSRATTSWRRRTSASSPRRSSRCTSAPSSSRSSRSRRARRSTSSIRRCSREHAGSA